MLNCDLGPNVTSILLALVAIFASVVASLLANRAISRESARTTTIERHVDLLSDAAGVSRSSQELREKEIVKPDL